MAAQPRRAIVRDLFTAAECAELIHIARCCSAAGFRDNCCVVNASIIARVHPPFLIPLARARDRVRDAVEQHLGLDLSLFIEFTGLISWRPGAAISWHRDNNREYLTQRAAAAVVYLNTAGLDFEGGTFMFRGGQGGDKEECVVASPGTAVMYKTSEEHCVAPAVTAGERFTLAMWFATEPEFDEDRGILAALSGRDEGGADAALGLPAALHALPGDGTDMRLCRLACHGVAFVRKEGDKGTWRVLQRLDDGEWDTPGVLRVAVLVEKDGGCDVGEPLNVSMRQVVWGAQQALLQRGGDGNRSGGGCTRECVCSRHVSAYSDVCGCPKLFERCVSSCQWLESAQPALEEVLVVGSGATRARQLRQCVETAIHEYVDRIEPLEAEEWGKLRAEWLRAGAVWGPA